MHPSGRLYGNKDRRLGGNRVLLCISGSIAATETVKLSRDLIRHGAEVIPLMTEAAARIIDKEAVHFACGTAPITSLSGEVEHISLFADDRLNAVVVAPATADVISKISLAIADDAVTTLCLNALGMNLPVIIAPSMSATMLNNPFLIENIERLRRQGVNVLPSIIAENEAKMLDSTFIVEEAARCFSRGTLRRRNVLVVGGAGEEPLDDVRLLTSRSTGRTAVEIATAAYEQKANVTMWCGRMEVELPTFLKISRFTTLSDLRTMIAGRKFDIVIVPASLPDFIPEKRRGKISSASDIELKLRRAPKFIEEVRNRCRVLVAFKAEIGIESATAGSGKRKLKAARLDMIIANSLEHVRENTTKAYILTAKSEEVFEGTKRELAEKIVDILPSL